MNIGLWIKYKTPVRHFNKIVQSNKWFFSPYHTPSANVFGINRGSSSAKVFTDVLRKLKKKIQEKIGVRSKWVFKYKNQSLWHSINEDDNAYNLTRLLWDLSHSNDTAWKVWLMPRTYKS